MSPQPTVATSTDAPPAGKPPNLWRDRTYRTYLAYVAYVATETVLFLDDAVFKVGLPLWIAHASDAPHGLAPLLKVLNNLMVVVLQVPLARFGTTTAATGNLLIPAPAAFALGGANLALPATGGAVTATVLLTAWAVAFTRAEMVHATISWELALALAPAPRRAPMSACTDSPSPPSAASAHSRSPRPSPPARSTGPSSAPTSL
ncbi:hypothetical protein [Streptomyces sp. NPDC101455]|uniref:hypothetical protein n=1 Tax=Streptomyces sp. NPDC101455 TaxID=3366142 RepID=UPI00380C1F07